MKAQINSIMILDLIEFISCETDNSIDKKVSYLYYLKDKSIIGIYIQGDTKYVHDHNFFRKFLNQTIKSN